MDFSEFNRGMVELAGWLRKHIEDVAGIKWEEIEVPNGIADWDRSACSRARQIIEHALGIAGGKVVEVDTIDPGYTLRIKLPTEHYGDRDNLDVTIRIDFGHHDFDQRDHSKAIEAREEIIKGLNRKLDQLSNFGKDIMAICDPKQR